MNAPVRHIAADAFLATALRSPDQIDAAFVIDALRAGAHPETSITYNDMIDVTPLVMTALLRHPDSTTATTYRRRIFANLFDRGANAGDAAGRILKLTIDALNGANPAEARRLIQAQHTLAIALASRLASTPNLKR